MCHVLIIEDDAIAAMDIRQTLEAAGATSFSFAASEREALEAARKQRPAVMTVDILLGSTSGVDAARAIRAELGSTPAILITATPDQCEGFRPDAVFEKPFDPVKLAAAFRLIAPASQT